MAYRKLGTCKFVLSGNPGSARARVDIVANVTDPVVPNLEFVVSQSWLLMLESQIGKVPKQIQDVVLDTLTGQTIVYYHYGTAQPQAELTSDMRHLADLNIELCYGKGPFVLANQQSHDRRTTPEALSGLIMANSFPAIFSVLKGEWLQRTLCVLMYGVHKWETKGRPSWITAFTHTWNFDSLQSMVDIGWQLIQKGWMTKLHSPGRPT